MDSPRVSIPYPDPPRRPRARAAAVPLPWWRRITVRFEVLIASVVVRVMLLLTQLMTYQVSSSARQAILAAASDSAQRISRMISWPASACIASWIRPISRCSYLHWTLLPQPPLDAIERLLD